LSGVSIATVSRVLNDHADVSDKTRERVLAVARQLDYTPSAAARTLVRQRSQLIGVILETGEGHPDLQHPFFQEVLVGLKHGVGDGGYDLLLFATQVSGNDSKNGGARRSYLRRARHHGVDGVVVMGVDARDAEVHDLARSRVPTVAIDLELVGRRASSRSALARPGARADRRRHGDAHHPAGRRPPSRLPR
jgi:LacI family transcriptional regulator